jgi:hypothetical protein
MVAPMDRITPPMEDKVDTSSAEVPTAQTWVAQPEGKAPNDNLGDDDPDLLNFATVGSKIACRTSFWLQRCWPDSGKPDWPVWDSIWFGFCAPLTPVMPPLYLAIWMSKVAFG